MTVLLLVSTSVLGPRTYVTILSIVGLAIARGNRIVECSEQLPCHVCLLGAWHAAWWWAFMCYRSGSATTSSSPSRSKATRGVTIALVSSRERKRRQPGLATDDPAFVGWHQLVRGIQGS